MSSTDSEDNDGSRGGVAAGLIAYSLWGVFPIYFKIVESVSATEVLAHRIVWAIPFGALILLLRHQWPEVRRAMTHRRMLSWLGLSALFITVNWFIYIWAVQNERIFETSLGYYINPLMYVIVGVLFFHEKLRRMQLAAVILATIGVLILSISGGSFPWVALGLAIFFTAYGVIRKRVAIGAMPGLFVETTLLFPFAFLWLGWLLLTNQASFGGHDLALDGLLLLAGPITVVPLLLFAVAARRLTLTTVGFMQFLAPTLQFLTGLYYGELLTTAHLLCFGFIWVAVSFFSIDAIRASRKKPLLENPTGA